MRRTRGSGARLWAKRSSKALVIELDRRSSSGRDPPCTRLPFASHSLAASAMAVWASPPRPKAVAAVGGRWARRSAPGHLEHGLLDPTIHHVGNPKTPHARRSGFGDPDPANIARYVGFPEQGVFEASGRSRVRVDGLHHLPPTARSTPGAPLLRARLSRAHVTQVSRVGPLAPAGRRGSTRWWWWSRFRSLAADGLDAPTIRGRLPKRLTAFPRIAVPFRALGEHARAVAVVST